MATFLRRLAILGALCMLTDSTSAEEARREVLDRADAMQSEDCSASLCAEWWAKDQANLKWLAERTDLLRLDSDGLARLVSEKDLAGWESPAPLGFGALRHELRTSNGGYLSISITVVTVEQQVAEYRIHLTSSGWELVKPHVASFWEGLGGPALDQGSHGAVLERRNPAVLSSFRRKLAEAFGEAREVDVPAELEAAYATLTSLVEAPAVGVVCGYAGMEPIGFTAVRQLVSSGRFDLLESVARGPGPEGRVYAAHALRSAVPPTPELRQLLGAVERHTRQVTVCNGCMFSRASAAEAFEVLGQGGPLLHGRPRSPARRP